MLRFFCYTWNDIICLLRSLDPTFIYLSMHVHVEVAMVVLKWSHRLGTTVIHWTNIVQMCAYEYEQG